MQHPPLSLYIHLPWCVKKCPYCDFNSHARTDLPEDQYLTSLVKDLEQDMPFVQGRAIHSIFFGGGTPSLMSGDFYLKLMDALRARLDFESDIEITLEANPGASDAAHFKTYAQAGINRISLGVQSFQNIQLEALGRIHRSDHIYKAVDAIHHSGINNFNLDLMHGLPGQSVEQAMGDLQQAFDLKPNHISWYQLTIEPNTEFFSRPPTLPDDELLWGIQKQGSQLLSEQGYEQYEVSAYAQEGRQARHNLNYWRFGDYIGLGAGAHSKVGFIDSGRLLRYRKSRMPEAYMADRLVYRVGEEQVERDAQTFEFMMNALRLKSGVEESLFAQRTELSFSDIEGVLATLRTKGLVAPGRIQLTEQGFLFLNSVLESFL